jgi:hypothetical protein
MHTKFFLGSLKGRLRHRWEDNIKMDLKEGGCEDVDWIHLPQDKHSNEPSGAIRCGEFFY